MVNLYKLKFGQKHLDKKLLRILKQQTLGSYFILDRKHLHILKGTLQKYSMYVPIQGRLLELSNL